MCIEILPYFIIIHCECACLFGLTAALVTIDIEQKRVNVTENQQFVEVCLVKNGTSKYPIMAVIDTEEPFSGSGSEGERPQYL